MILKFLRQHYIKLSVAMLTLVFGLAAVFIFRSRYDNCSPTQSSPCAILEGRTVRLVASGVSFEVPQAWLDWQTRFHNNFHLTPWQLRKAKHGSGDWDYEYGQVANAVLPFETCSVHAGDESWGSGSVTFADLQMRVYVGAWTLHDIRQKVATNGVAQANRVARDAKVVAQTFGAWQHDGISYKVSYRDYGGTANVDFYSRAGEGRAVVFVFMHTGKQEPTIAQILESSRAEW